MSNFLAMTAIIVAIMVPLCGVAYYREKQYQRLMNVTLTVVVIMTGAYMLFMLGHVTGASRAFSHMRGSNSALDFDWYMIASDPFTPFILPIFFLAVLPALPTVVNWVKAADDDSPNQNDGHS